MLQHRFIDSALKNPSKVAFIDRTTLKDVTFNQALLGSLILSRRFRKLETGRIGIMLPTSAGAALAVIGSVMGGLTPVMINYSTGAEKNYVYAQQQCDFKTVITTRPLLEKTGCPELPGMVFIEEIMAGLSKFEKTLGFMKSKAPVAILKRLTGPENLSKPAVILFTSGSEKDPKVVQLSQQNLLSNIDAFCDMMDVYSMDRLLAVLPYFHVFGLTINLWTPMCLGMTSITYANPLEFRTVANIIKETEPELLIGTPLFLEGYARQSNAGDFKSVVLTVSGADKCPESLRKLYRDKHQLEIFEGYGATETSPVISVNPRASNRPGSIGLPIPNTSVKIQSYETGNECPTGQVGKILVKGDGVMDGYLNDVEESSLRLKSGWYDTGDLGYLDEDGYLWHKGRLKRFVKIGGEMISLVMVEEILDEMTPEDIECCVVEIPDAKRGSRIVAVTNAEIEKSEIQKKLSKKLPNIALPKSYTVVPEFPRMGSGKTDFRTLTELVRKQLKDS
ncbi:MAG: acyl-[acyl-carrier-protein]-phospholipid O-acyltransferase [Paracoccaceae bacterium]|jgi:acyl-[acyl-carrier-protein]-phospholipid O-acyltransferase/long-chain-fatty-acid--[acyl-carrier-protein] ligase